MVRHLVGLFLSTVLILLSLPFLAVSFLVAATCTLAASALPGFHGQQASPTIRRHQLHRVNHLEYENAISSYEDLIGAQAWKRP